MAFVWFKKMISFPVQEKLTKTASFTQWTALLAYGGGGLVLLCAPSLWGMLLAFELSGRVEGYLRLTGVYLITLSFIYIIVARAGSCSSKHGPMLSSILERLVLVNGILLVFIIRNILPLYFALLFILLDTALSLTTLGIWIKETHRTSVLLYFKEVFSSCQKRPSLNKSTVPYLSVKIIGALQICGGVILMTVPQLIQEALKLDPFEYHAEGFLSCSFLLIAIHGWFHIMASGVELAAFTTAALFYRLSFTIPLQFILYICNQIELYLFILLGTCEFIFALILLLSFLLKNCKRKGRIHDFNNKQGLRREGKPENLEIENVEDMTQRVNYP